MGMNIHWGNYEVPQTTTHETAYILGNDGGYGEIKYFEDDRGYINALCRLAEVLYDRDDFHESAYVESVVKGLEDRTYDVSNGMPDIEGY